MKLSKAMMDALVEALHPKRGPVWRLLTFMEEGFVGATTLHALVRRGLLRIDSDPGVADVARPVFATVHLTDAGRAIAQAAFDASPTGKRVAASHKPVTP